MRFLIITLALLYACDAFAQSPDSEETPRVVYKQTTEIDFEALELEGKLVKPDGALLLERKKANFNPMIRLRTDFDSEMAQSVNEVK